MLTAVLTIPLAILGAYLYRWRGGAPPQGWPRILRIGLYSVLLTAPAWFLVPWYAAGTSLALCTAAVAMGHGDWIDMGHSRRTDPNEFWNFIVHRLTDKRNGWVHDSIGMTLSGLSYTIPLGAILGYYAVPWLGFVALIGALKAPAYVIGWWAYEVLGDWGYPKHYRPGAEWGELLTGLFTVGAVAAVTLPFIL